MKNATRRIAAARRVRNAAATASVAPTSLDRNGSSAALIDMPKRLTGSV
jgi:hypothetical protein